MRFKQCHKPAMTGNGRHTTYKDGDDWGMVYSSSIRIRWVYGYGLWMVINDGWGFHKRVWTNKPSTNPSLWIWFMVIHWDCLVFFWMVSGGSLHLNRLNHPVGSLDMW